MGISQLANEETEITAKITKTTGAKRNQIRSKEIYIPDTIIIYGSKVATISTIKGNFGFVVEDKEFSNQ